MIKTLRAYQWIWYHTESLQRFLKELQLPLDSANAIAQGNALRLFHRN